MHGLIGGLHRAQPDDDLIPWTVEAIAGFAPRVVLADCTGWRALHALVDALGEGVVDPLAVGSRHRL